MTLLKWALICFVLALIAGALGLRRTAGVLKTIAKIFFFIFLAIFIILLVLALLVISAVAVV